MFDVEGFRNHFPGLGISVSESPLVYFDNAASSLKCDAVIERVSKYQKFEASNVHRGAHTLSQKGTENYEQARGTVANFVGANSPDEIIFTRGTTESINLVAQSYVAQALQPGDEIVISCFEHHSNIVPWQNLAQKLKLHLRVVSFCPDVGFSLENFKKTLGSKTKFVSVLWYSNALGMGLPVVDIIKASHEKGALVMLDAAQTVLHQEIRVQDLDVDFLCFSGHKMFAPYGIGALYGKKDLLQQMEPYQFGGAMIDRVSFEETRYADAPQKFEAGTPNVSGALGLGAACDFIKSKGIANWGPHLAKLRGLAMDYFQQSSVYKVYDFPSSDYSAVISFNHKEAHASDIGTLLDKYGIAIRAGHHCTQPLMSLLGTAGTVRVSFAPYNTVEEVQFFCETLESVNDFF